MNKKGIFFTFAAIALAIIIIFSFKVYTDYGLKDKVEVIEIRVTTMNDFIKDMENDIENAIFISGFRSLLGLEDYMMDHDEFFNGVDTPTMANAFDEVFRLGTIPYGASTDNMDLMDNNTFLNWTERMKSEANKTDISLKFTVNSVTISHSEPWRIDVTVNLDIEVEDKKHTAKWIIDDKDYTKQINITSETSIKFVDPLYLINTNGLVNNTIRKTIVDPTLNLGTHLSNSYYIEHTDAPNYLMRFENNLNPDPDGIESLVYLPALEAKGISISSKTAVDYIYFDSSNNPTGDLIEDMEVTYPWFYLDYNPPCVPESLHMAYYGATCDIP